MPNREEVPKELLPKGVVKFLKMGRMLRKKIPEQIAGQMKATGSLEGSKQTVAILRNFVELESKNKKAIEDSANIVFGQ